MVVVSSFNSTDRVTCLEPFSTSSVLVATEDSNNNSSPTSVGIIVSGAIIFGVLLFGLACRAFIKHQGRVGFLPHISFGRTNQPLAATPGNVIASPSGSPSTNDTIFYPVASVHGGVNATE